MVQRDCPDGKCEHIFRKDMELCDGTEFIKLGDTFSVSIVYKCETQEDDAHFCGSTVASPVIVTVDGKELANTRVYKVERDFGEEELETTAARPFESAEIIELKDMTIEIKGKPQLIARKDVRLKHEEGYAYVDFTAADVSYGYAEGAYDPDTGALAKGCGSIYELLSFCRTGMDVNVRARVEAGFRIPAEFTINGSPVTNEANHHYEEVEFFTRTVMPREDGAVLKVASNKKTAIPDALGGKKFKMVAVADEDGDNYEEAPAGLSASLTMNQDMSCTFTKNNRSWRCKYGMVSDINASITMLGNEAYESGIYPEVFFDFFFDEDSKKYFLRRSSSSSDEEMAELEKISGRYIMEEI
jgi:hypothetical protein